MARSEARLFTSIWRDPHFLSLEVGPQRLYMFLLSQDDLTYCGVIPLRPSRWAPKAAGLTVADIGQALKVLEAAPRVFTIADEDTGELFVRSLLRRDEIWRQPNLLKRAREDASQIESPRIRAALLAELRRLPLDETPSEQVKTLVADFIQDLEEGSGNPSAYPSGNPDPDPTEDPSGNPSGKDYARARGSGERNGSSGTDSPIPITPDPSFAVATRDRKRGTRLPEPFVVTQAMKDWFRENCPHVDARVEHAKFLDHWRGKAGKDGCKLDWPATWRNWMRTAEQRAAPRNRGSRQDETDALFQAAAERIEAREAAS